MTGIYYTATYVEDRLIDAAIVIEAVGDKEMGWLKCSLKSSMPETLKWWGDDWLNTLRDVRPMDETGRGEVTSQRIDMADQCLDWLKYPNGMQRKVIGYVIRMKMRGIDPPKWRWIQRRLGWSKVSDRTIANRYKRGLNVIAEELNKKNNLTDFAAFAI